MTTTALPDTWQLQDHSSRRAVTINTAATLYDASRDTITRMIAAGELKAKKVHSVWRVSVAELDRAFGVSD